MIDSKTKCMASLVRRPLLAAAMAASVATPAPALAAVNAYLKLTNVDGESTTKGHEKWIEIESFSLGFDSGAKLQRTGGGAAKSACEPLGVLKRLDKSSPALLTAVMAGQQFPTAQLELVHSEDASGKPFLVYKFGTVFTTKIDWTGPSDAGPEETITFVYGTLGVSYTRIDANGAPAGDPVVVTVDCGR